MIRQKTMIVNGKRYEIPIGKDYKQFYEEVLAGMHESKDKESLIEG